MIRLLLVASALLLTQAGCDLLVAVSAKRPYITDLEIEEPSADSYEGEIPFLVHAGARRAEGTHLSVRVDGEEVASGEVGEAFTWLPEGPRRPFVFEITFVVSNAGGQTYQATGRREVAWRPTFAVDVEGCDPSTSCVRIEADGTLTVRDVADLTVVPRDSEDVIADVTYALDGRPLDVSELSTSLDLRDEPDTTLPLAITATRDDGAVHELTVHVAHAGCTLPPADLPEAPPHPGLSFDAMGSAYLSGVREGAAVLDRLEPPPSTAHTPGWLSDDEGRFGPLDVAGGVPPRRLLPRRRGPRAVAGRRPRRARTRGRRVPPHAVRRAHLPQR